MKVVFNRMQCPELKLLISAKRLNFDFDKKIMFSKYEEQVGSRFHIYNSLFLNLPFQHISRTGTLLPLLQQQCETDFEKGISAGEIVDRFFHDFVPGFSRQEQFDLLFNFIQYVERQVALFDSVEDSAFEQVHDLKGKGENRIGVMNR